MAIGYVRVRATIVTSDFTVSTPHIMSIDVTRTRGQVGVFSASVKVPKTTTISSSGSIVIWAGTVGNIRRIFTGYIRKIRIQPAFDDPNFILVRLDGADVLDRLTNTKFTRREAISDKVWAVVTGVQRQVPPDEYVQFSYEDSYAYSQADLRNNNVPGPKKELPKFGSATGGVPLGGIPIVITEVSGE